MELNFRLNGQTIFSDEHPKFLPPVNSRILAVKGIYEVVSHEFDYNSGKIFIDVVPGEELGKVHEPREE